MGEPQFPERFPVEGIGFYDWEIWRSDLIPGWTGDKPIRFRWMGVQAFVPTDKPSRLAYMKKHQGKNEKTPEKYGLRVFLRSVHPDVASNPVVVEIYTVMC